MYGNNSETARFQEIFGDNFWAVSIRFSVNFIFSPIMALFLKGILHGGFNDIINRTDGRIDAQIQKWPRPYPNISNISSFSIFDWMANGQAVCSPSICSKCGRTDGQSPPLSPHTKEALSLEIFSILPRNWKNRQKIPEKGTCFCTYVEFSHHIVPKSGWFCFKKQT